MPNNQDIEIRSEQVQEILTVVPNWMIRWGNTLLIILIFMMLFLSWFVKYPDIISTKAIVTTQIPPEKLFAQSSGKITHFLVNDTIDIPKNTPIAIIENSANYKDVFLLQSIVDTIKFDKHSFVFPIDELPLLFLGELEPNFTLFENSYMQYLLNKRLHTYKTKKSTETNKTREEIQLLRPVIQSFKQLKNGLKDWKKKFVLINSIEGKVSYFNYQNENQTVQNGDLVFTIIPSATKNFNAKLKAPARNSGKIKKGQFVQIKLENYPSEEFGVLNGVISAISSVPDKNGMYLIDVILPNKMKTSFNKYIPFKQEMIGSADIITEDLRLIERFLPSI